jgi:hypothetical protein
MNGRAPIGTYGIFLSRTRVRILASVTPMISAASLTLTRREGVWSSVTRRVRGVVVGVMVPGVELFTNGVSHPDAVGVCCVSRGSAVDVDTVDLVSAAAQAIQGGEIHRGTLTKG